MKKLLIIIGLIASFSAHANVSSQPPEQALSDSQMMSIELLSGALTMETDVFSNERVVVSIYEDGVMMHRLNMSEETNTVKLSQTGKFIEQAELHLAPASRVGAGSIELNAILIDKDGARMSYDALIATWHLK
tara:strand:+ start:125742 stop:126140 length:399 start_codon:yes stop_codon:yes gene_type:complete